MSTLNYKCGICYTRHSSEEDAEECFRECQSDEIADVYAEWVCDVCGDSFDEEEDADECCRTVVVALEELPRESPGQMHFEFGEGE